MCRPSGEKATRQTISAWSSCFASSLPVSTSQRRTLLSMLEETSNLPSGEKATQLTWLVCPWKRRTSAAGCSAALRGGRPRPGRGEPEPHQGRGGEGTDAHPRSSEELRGLFPDGMIPAHRLEILHHLAVEVQGCQRGAVADDDQPPPRPRQG